MKKLATLIAMLAVFALLAGSVSALQLTGATIGNNNQDRIKNVSSTFTVTNNDTTSVTVTFASTADVKYNVRFEPATVTLAAGQQSTVQVIADIPLNFNAVETSRSSPDFLKEFPFKIGDIQGKIGTIVAATAELKVQAVNQLNIKKGRLQCGDKSESLDDGDKVKNLRPDLQCSLEVEVENQFSENDQEDSAGRSLNIGDIEFDTVNIQARIDDQDFDVNEDDDADGLSADDKDTVTLSFDIDEDVDEGTYTMDIYAQARDDNGATHGEHWVVRIEIKRLTHDLQVRSATITPLRLSACDGGTVRVNARILNAGKRDEKRAAVELDVPDLKFTKRIDQIELDKDDSTSASFTFDVPANTKAGVYRAILTTFFDTTAQSNAQALEFTVDKCVQEVETTTEPVTQTGQTGATTQATPTTTSSEATGAAVAVPRARVRSTSFTDSSAYLWLLGGLAVVLLLIVIGLLAVAFRKPRQDVL
jgi:hypothetical protein